MITGLVIFGLIGAAIAYRIWLALHPEGYSRRDKRVVANSYAEWLTWKYPNYTLEEAAQLRIDAIHRSNYLHTPAEKDELLAARFVIEGWYR